MQKTVIPELEQYPINDSGNLPLYVFPQLVQCGMVKHGFTTRLGGVSEGIFSTLNLSFSRGDKQEAVEENYRRLAEALDVSYESFVLSNQTHTTNVIRVGAEDAGNGIIRSQKYQDVDGMVTNETGVTLVTSHADCVPLYFADPVHRAIGLSHSGWRGTAGRMGRATLEKMHQEFGTDPADVLCAIGPSICQSCYEVSEDVAETFRAQFPGKEEEILIQKEMPSGHTMMPFGNNKEKPSGHTMMPFGNNKENRKYQLDLWKANEIILLEAGVLSEHLSVTKVCTCCNPKLLFSHRASMGKRGNLAAVMALK